MKPEKVAGLAKASQARLCFMDDILINIAPVSVKRVRHELLVQSVDNHIHVSMTKREHTFPNDYQRERGLPDARRTHTSPLRSA
jgi:hypothetical protein